MHFSVKWFDGKYPSFNLGFHKAESQPEFLSIKGCRIVSGSNGEFVSYPAQKKDDGKYWNHVWADDKFNSYVLELANKSRPSRNDAPKQQSRVSHGDGLDSDIPF